MPQKTLFSRLKSGERVVVGYKGKEPFEIEWGPRGPEAHLTRYIGGTSTRSPMSESECYDWLAKEEADGLAEVSRKDKIASAAKKVVAEKTEKKSKKGKK